MKIGIIGASGKSGQCLTKEGLLRGYKVVALVRDASKMESLIKDENLIVREIDLNNENSIVINTKDIDVLVSAYGPSGSDSSMHEKFAHTLINVVKTNKNIKKLLVIGGAGSLLNDKEQLVLESDIFPQEWRTHASMQLKALQVYQKSDINWTYFSPSLWYLPEGQKTNNFIFGKDHLLFNDKGESKISYADVALILINEIKDNKYNKTRFTATTK